MMNKSVFFKRMSFLGVVFLVFMVIGYGYTVGNRGEKIINSVSVPKVFSQQFGNVIIRERLSKMEKATFLSPEGRRLNWEVFEGQYLLVNFWATWCAPCVLELPSLEKLKETFEGKGLAVISISLDTMRGHDDIKKFLNNRGIGEFASYLDDVGEVKKNTYMRGIPTSYLLDKQGNIRYIFEGDADWSAPSAISFFQSVLNTD